MECFIVCVNTGGKLVENSICQILGILNRYWKNFKQLLPNDVAIELTDVLQASEPLTLNVSQENLSAEIFQGEIEQDWRVTSFSGIEQTHQCKAYLNESAVKKSLIF